jgi:hypothetical protein
MKIMLIQLSDIHVESGSDDILRVAEDLAAAVYPCVPNTGHIFILLTGDIAFSGHDTEYAAVAAFLQRIQELLRKEAGCPVDFIAVPGNHDCDFRLDNGARRNQISAILNSAAPEIDDSVIAQCTSVQRHFLDFRDRLETTPPLSDDSLWRTKRYVVGARNIVFECLNIAWMSQKQEQIGRLYFPADRYERMPTTEGDLRISLLHQPFNWLSQPAYRPLRTLIRRISDIVLTGHEHVANVGAIEESASGKSIFIEGGVLQESSADISSSAFNVVQIDLDQSKFLTTRYAWQGTKYLALDDSSWTAYRDLPPRLSQSRIVPEFQRVLDDVGAPLRHPGRQEVTLEDLFVYPELLEITDKPNQRLYKSSTFLVNPEAIGSGIVIEGDDKSGRSSLLRHLFREHLDKGFYPVMISGKQFNREDDAGVRRAIETAVLAEYGAERLEEIMQAPREQRVALIDDFDDSKVRSGAGTSELIKNIQQRFTHVLFTVGSFEMNQTDPLRGKELMAFTRLQVQPFGYYLRSRLIAKWHSLGADGTVDDAALLSRRDQSERIINYVMKRGLIPAAPLYLLTLLQSIEAGRSGDFKDSALGYYYQYLLTESFAQSGVRPNKLTELFEYCSRLAWHFHSSKAEALSETDLRSFNEEFSREWHTVDFSERLKVLVDSHVLCLEGGEYRFRYPYIYYFLKGQYMDAHLSEDAVKTYVQHCCEHLYVRDHAHTLLFLAHHTNDPFVIEAIEKSLQGSFAVQKPVMFSGDTTGMAKLMNEIPKLSYGGGTPEEHRDRVNKLRDQIEGRNDPLLDEEESTEELSLPAQVTLLLKTTEILGQILKNQYSKIQRKRKIELLNEVFSGPLRALRGFYALLEANPEALVIAVETALENVVPKPDENARKRMARRIASSIVLLLSHGFIARAAEGGNSESLAEDVADVVKRNGSTAFHLIDVAISLDSASHFPRAKLRKVLRLVRDEPIAYRILQLIVLNRLYMFKTSESDLQWLASDLGLDIGEIHAIAYSQGKNRRLK